MARDYSSAAESGEEDGMLEEDDFEEGEHNMMHALLRSNKPSPYSVGSINFVDSSEQTSLLHHRRGNGDDSASSP